LDLPSFFVSDFFAPLETSAELDQLEKDHFAKNVNVGIGKVDESTAINSNWNGKTNTTENPLSEELPLGMSARPNFLEFVTSRYLRAIQD
jgi:hypothetical protein